MTILTVHTSSPTLSLFHFILPISFYSSSLSSPLNRAGVVIGVFSCGLTNFSWILIEWQIGMDDEYSTIGDKGEVGFIDVPSVTTSTPTEEGPVMVSVPFPFAGGKPQSVLVNEVAVASFTIENTTDEYILLWGVKIYASIPEDSFVLSLMKPPSGQPDDIPEEDFVPCFDMEERNLNPHGSLTIWMSCVPKEIGLFTSILHIQTDQGIIERLVFLLAEDEVSKALAPQRPYNIPTQIKKAIEFEEIPEVVLQGLTEENYVSYFNELLGMEELLIMVSVMFSMYGGWGTDGIAIWHRCLVVPSC